MSATSERSTLVVAVLAIGLGLFILALSADVISVDPQTLHAPRWVVAAIGLAFLLAGVMLLNFQRYKVESAQMLLGAAVLSLLGAVATWVAFGTGERAFEAACILPFVSFGTGADELTGRIAFGISAVILDLLAIGTWIQGVRQLLRGR